MKVLVSLAESASVKEFVFKKTIDTTNPQSASPETREVVAAPSSLTGLKKKMGITHIVELDDGELAVARKSGEIEVDGEIKGNLDGEVVGLSEIPGTGIAAFSSTGSSILISSSGTIEFKLRSDLSSVCQNPKKPTQFASAGSKQLPDVFSISVDKSEVTTETTWRATQPPNDMLDLPEQNLVTGLSFVNTDKLISVTSHGKIRVYDLNDSSGQPDQMIQASKDAIKSVTADPTHPNTLIVGDSRSLVSRWSLDPPKLLGYYKGVNGSTRALSVRGAFVAIGGLDRYIRVYDVVKRQLAGRVYAGSEIWAIKLMRTDDEEAEEELDDFWDGLNPSNKRSRPEDHDSVAPKAKASKVKQSTAESEVESENESEGLSESFEGFDD